MSFVPATIISDSLLFATASSQPFHAGIFVAADDRSNEGDPISCRDKFAALVRDLDVVLTRDPIAVDEINRAIERHSLINDCSVEDILPIAQASLFFKGSEDHPLSYNISFDNAGHSKGFGFHVLVTLNKRTGSIERPFAMVNRIL